MSTLFVMCGLPGSGKSYTAQRISQKTKAVIVSSDAMRAKLYGDAKIQGNPHQVFAEVDKEIEILCSRGESVILDATSISAWSRQNALQKHPGFNTYVCIYINTSIEKCLERNSKRDRHVPEEVIRGMAKKFEKPVKEEGFNRIITL